jgi:hypothetical protein
VTDPEPAVCANVIGAVLLDPELTVFPPASSIVAVNVLAEADAREPVAPESKICVAAPTLTVTVSVLDVVRPGPLRVALAARFTVPARAPVTESVAMPPLAEALPSPVTVPVPPGLAKVTLTPASAPVETVFPAASSIVAVRVSETPEARAVPPVSTILVAPPAVTVTGVEALLAVHECQTAVTL